MPIPFLWLDRLPDDLSHFTNDKFASAWFWTKVLLILFPSKLTSFVVHALECRLYKQWAIDEDWACPDLVGTNGPNVFGSATILNFEFLLTVFLIFFLLLFNLFSRFNLNRDTENVVYRKRNSVRVHKFLHMFRINQQMQLPKK